MSTRPVRDAALGGPQPSATPAWRSLPSWFVFGDADRTIPVEGLRFMAQRAGAVSVTEVPGGSRSVMVSNPDRVVSVILEALEHLSR